MISTITEFEMGGQQFILGADGQVYQETKGPIVATVPAADRLKAQWAPESRLTANGSLVKSVTLPASLGQYRWIHDHFFSKYTHEVLCLVGRPWKDMKKVVFFVPEQEVRQTHVEMTEKGRGHIEEFAKVAKVLGDLHSHPWVGFPTPSGTDMRDMASNPGIHSILGKNGEMTVCVSIRGIVMQYGQVDLAKHEAKGASIWTNEGVPISDLMIEPKVQVYVGGGWKNGDTVSFDLDEWEKEKEDAQKDDFMGLVRQHNQRCYQGGGGARKKGKGKRQLDTLNEASTPMMSTGEIYARAQWEQQLDPIMSPARLCSFVEVQTPFGPQLVVVNEQGESQRTVNDLIGDLNFGKDFKVNWRRNIGGLTWQAK